MAYTETGSETGAGTTTGATTGTSAGAHDWVGKRKPTPAELRAYSQAQGWGTDAYENTPDAELGGWIDQFWNVERGRFNSARGEIPEDEWWAGPADLKPWDTPAGWAVHGNQAVRNEELPAWAGGGGGGGMGGGGGGWGGGGWGSWGPTYEQAQSDPGYQFAFDEGQRALEQSAAARGLLRTGGTLQDLVDYGQGMGAQQYQNVWNRWYAPWQTQYQGNLQKYLQREGNIFSLLNAPPWQAYGAY